MGNDIENHFTVTELQIILELINGAVFKGAVLEEAAALKLRIEDYIGVYNESNRGRDE